MPINSLRIENPSPDRNSYIGGSDAAAVLGLSRWQTPLTIWAEKTGQIVPRELDTEAAELGEYLEEYVARRFTRETGKKVQRVNETRFHPIHSFLGANIDRRVIGEDSILECKTTSAWKAREWDGEDIPHEYILQVMHYLAVTGAKKAYVAVLIGNQDFKWKVVERDEQLIGEMVSREVSFWNDFVLTRVMPTTISKGDSSTLFELYPVAQAGTEIELGDEAAALIESRNSLYQDQISIEGQIEKLENEIKALLKENESAKAGNWRITWKNQTTNRCNVKLLKEKQPDVWLRYAETSATRVLRIKEATNGNR